MTATTAMAFAAALPVAFLLGKVVLQRVELSVLYHEGAMMQAAVLRVAAVPTFVLLKARY